MAELPYHESEACFRKFELTICSAVNHFPEVLRIKSSDMDVAPTTYAARLRDAIASYYKNEWKSQVNLTRFRQVKPRLQVSHRRDIVMIGDKDALKTADELPEVVTPFQVDGEITIQVTTMEQKTMLCSLSAEKAFSKRIKILGLSLTDVEYLEKHYDVAIKLIEDGSHLLL